MVPFDVGAVAAVDVADDLAVREHRLRDQRGLHRGRGPATEAAHQLDSFAVVEQAGEERVLGEQSTGNLERDLAESGDHAHLAALDLAAPQGLGADEHHHVSACRR